MKENSDMPRKGIPVVAFLRDASSARRVVACFGLRQPDGCGSHDGSADGFVLLENVRLAVDGLTIANKKYKIRC